MRSASTRRRIPLLALALTATAFAQAADSNAFRVDPQRYLADVRVLASDELGGRGNGTPGLRRAAEYIASEFERAQLAPGGENGTFFQSFDASGQLDDAPSNLVVTSDGLEVPFRIGLHYYPLSTPETTTAGQLPGSSPARIGLVFAGYGIVAPGLGYDDYAGLDVSGKAVIVYTHEPQEQSPRSIFEGTALTPHGDIAHKVEVAHRRGARLLIVVEDPSHVTDRAATPAWTRDPQIGMFDIPVVRVDRARLDKLLASVDLEGVAREIDSTLTPKSQVITGASVAFTDPIFALNPRLQNVVGILEGSDPALAAEAIVVGAHYDHLGLGGRFSRAPASTGQIHNGADDNASGTAMVIEMARAAREQRGRFARSIVFATFAGEELGLLGSRYYVQHAPITMRKTVAMINLDMVGRAHGRVMVGGSQRPPRLTQMVTTLARQTTLRLDDFRDGYEDGASDNGSFERERVPTLLFFTGFHDDYHSPGDDWDRIDASGAAEIARLALAVLAKLANQ